MYMYNGGVCDFGNVTFYRGDGESVKQCKGGWTVCIKTESRL